MKILFVDVDGPLIPASQFLLDRFASMERRIPPLTVAMLNKICQETGALVVMNTTHNRNFSDVQDITMAMVEAGFNSDYFHPTSWKTKYPRVDREKAVNDWLLKHDEVDDYVCIDDVQCADDDHMLLVDPDIGLTVAGMNQIIERFGGDLFIVFV